MDMMSDAALPEHHTDNQEQQIEETNVVSVKQVTEEVSGLFHSYYRLLFKMPPCIATEC